MFIDRAPNLKLALILYITSVLLLIGTSAGAADNKLITHGPRDRQQVALTFDICQTPGKPTTLDRPLINILKKEKIPVTFFIGGDWMRTHPQELQKLAAVPFFELANHSWSHPNLQRKNATEIATQVERTAAELKRQTGRTSNLFRLPYGYYNDETLTALTKLKQRVIQWDVVSGDPDPLVTTEEMILALKAEIQNGSIIIMHANGRGHHTAAALPEIIADLRQRQLRPVTISTLLAE